MRRTIALLTPEMVLVLLISQVALGAGQKTTEEAVALDKVPTAVMETAKARFKGAQITSAAKELEEGKVVYEVSLKKNGKTIDIILTPAGSIVLFEKQITREQLPKRVASALEKNYPKAKYEIVEEVFKTKQQKEAFAFYEVLLVTKDSKTLTVQVTTDGKVINVEEKTAGAD